MSDPVSSDPVTPDAPDAALPPSLRLLKWLVILLTLSMIGAVITVVWLLVTRMPQVIAGTAPQVPEALQLPEGKTAAAVTFGTGWTAVVTTDDHILIFGKDGKLRQDVVISPTGP
jgi:Flp pilus assembly protein protease CpaA